jgi:DNA-binding FadR family transcriptional regulator
MERTRDLRSSLERSLARKRRLEQQLSEFAANRSDPKQQQDLRRLQYDLENANIEISALQNQLDDPMD